MVSATRGSEVLVRGERIKRRRRRGRSGAAVAAVLALVATLAAAVLAGCGSSSQQAETLLRQTFSGAHTVTSGVLDLSLRIVPTGSTELRGPIAISLAGSFQDRGDAGLPAADLRLSIAALGEHGALSLISTGTHGYVTLAGQSYELPQASFRGIASSFAAAQAAVGGSTTAGGASTTAGGGSKRSRLDPLSWLSNPTIVGRQSIDGTETTQIRAQVDVRRLLASLSRTLASAVRPGSGASGRPSGISPQVQSKLAGEVGTPSLDVWTGDADRTLRRLTLTLVLPVSGSLRATLGGLRSARITLTVQYSELNQPQTIVAPSRLRPYRQLQAKLEALLGLLGAAIGSRTSA